MTNGPAGAWTTHVPVTDQYKQVTEARRDLLALFQRLDVEPVILECLRVGGDSGGRVQRVLGVERVPPSGVDGFESTFTLACSANRRAWVLRNRFHTPGRVAVHGPERLLFPIDCGTRPVIGFRSDRA